MVNNLEQASKLIKNTIDRMEVVRNGKLWQVLQQNFYSDALFIEAVNVLIHNNLIGYFYCTSVYGSNFRYLVSNYSKLRSIHLE
jgi:hypothetical protein